MAALSEELLTEIRRHNDQIEDKLEKNTVVLTEIRDIMKGDEKDRSKIFALAATYGKKLEQPVLNLIMAALAYAAFHLSGTPSTPTPVEVVPVQIGTPAATMNP